MIKGGTKGSSTTTGLIFEKSVDLITSLSKIKGYKIKKSKTLSGYEIFYHGAMIARSFKKYDFYKFLQEQDIDYATIISKKLLPDEALLVRDTLTIIEIKYQAGAGSVDEKLQTCDFKKKQYIKLVDNLNLKVDYIYFLSDWFKKPEYKDVLDYIDSVNCSYAFNRLSLEWLGLPS